MVCLADVFTMTTTLQALMDALAPLLRPLRLLGLRPKKLTLAVALVVRFVPVLLERWRAREEAWRARTGRRRVAAPRAGVRGRDPAPRRPRRRGARRPRLRRRGAARLTVVEAVEYGTGYCRSPSSASGRTSRSSWAQGGASRRASSTPRGRPLQPPASLRGPVALAALASFDVISIGFSIGALAWLFHIALTAQSATA